MNVMLFKLVAFLAVLVTGLVGGFLSVRITAFPRSERIFSFGNAFAGGIFLGAALLHMLPDAREGFQSFVTVDFPWAFFVCACGFLLVMFTEKILMQKHEDAITEAEERSGGCGFYAFVLTLVLSVHSIIAGIALGVEETIVKGAILLFAIIAHKGSATFALGVSLHRAGINTKRLVQIISFFCLMTPLGIALGSALTVFLTGKAELVFGSVFDALAAGTFLYISLLHIIEEEFIEHDARGVKFALLSFGLGMMAVLAIWL